MVMLLLLLFTAAAPKLLLLFTAAAPQLLLLFISPGLFNQSLTLELCCGSLAFYISARVALDQLLEDTGYNVEIIVILRNVCVAGLSLSGLIHPQCLNIVM